jgi:hypothetical protein
LIQVQVVLLVLEAMSCRRRHHLRRRSSAGVTSARLPRQVLHVVEDRLHQRLRRHLLRLKAEADHLVSPSSQDQSVGHLARSAPRLRLVAGLPGRVGRYRVLR